MGWGIEGESTPAPKPAKGIKYSGGAKKKKGCPITALMVLPLMPFAMALLALGNWRERNR